jgi:hypothetical protein
MSHSDSLTNPLSFQVGRHPVKPTTTNNGGTPLVNPTRHPPPDRNISRQRGNNFGDISSPEAGRKSSLGSQCGAAPLLSGNNFNSTAAPGGAPPFANNMSWQRSVIGPAVHQHAAPPPPPQRPSRLPIVSVYNPKQAVLAATALDMKAVLRPTQQSPPPPVPLLLPRKSLAGTQSPEPPPLSPKADRHMSAVASMSSGGGGGAVTLSGGITVKRSATGPLGVAVAGPLAVVTGQPWAAAAVPTAAGGGRRAMSPRRGDISRRLAAASPTFPTARRRSPSITRSVSNNVLSVGNLKGGFPCAVMN